jgi:hypothetical protein
MQRFFNALSAATGLLLVAAALQACSSNNSTGVTPVRTASPTPSPLNLLVPGTTATYTGTETAAVTFVSPGSKNPNSNASYTTAEAYSVASSAASAPAPYQVTHAVSYTVNSSSTPTYGIEPKSITTTDYENVTASGGLQTVTLTQADVAETGTNLTSILNNGGSGAYTSSTTTTYSPNTTLAIYPLTTGETWSTNETRSVAAQTSTATASSGTQSSNTTTNYQSDDSFTVTGTLTNGDSTTRSELSNGSATVTNTGPKPLSESIAVPEQSPSPSGPWVIPVTQTVGSGSPATTYAADWYSGTPANQLPPSPLGSTVYTVVGATSSLPTGCSVTGNYPNIIEYDSATTVTNVIAATYDTASARFFDSNGLIVCRLTTATTYNYNTATGLLVSTTTTNTSSSLTSYTASSKYRNLK